MARRGGHPRGRKGPQQRDPHRAHTAARPVRRVAVAHPADEPGGEPDLLAEVRRRLRTGQPLDLLAEVSGVLNAVDRRNKNAFAGSDDENSTQVSLEGLVQTFTEVDLAETSSLLACVAQLAADDLVRARACRALASRRQPLPPWLAQLGETAVYRAVEMVHVLGDGDNLMLGVRLPAGHELSVVVYIDHNMGTVVKDAFAVPDLIADLIDFMRARTDDPDLTWRDLDLADARARITEAVATGAMTFPPFETDTWPACRPIVEWILRLLPGGGAGYRRPDWSEAATRSLAERFFASPFAVGADDPDHRGLLDSILWFGTDYGPGDPLRWSPVAVEILLLDWIPRKIVAEVTYLAKAPELLRAFIRFCHDDRQLRPALTADTLAALSQFEPEYQQVIRSPRLQGPAALLAAMGVPGPDAELAGGALAGGALAGGALAGGAQDDGEEFSIAGYMLSRLRAAVGSETALDSLDDRQLPDEEFRWSDVQDEIRPQVADVLSACDACCDALLDTEFRTACRRLLARAAVGDPAVFRRKARADTAAAAVCWLVGKANDLFTSYGGGMLVKDLMGHFGLAQGGVSPRAAALLKAAGISDSGPYGEVQLGTGDLLVSQRRQRIIEQRDQYRLASSAEAGLGA
jgi:Domain of unknown function (DUF6398)